MPKVRLNFEIRSWVTHTVKIPQAVIDEYNRETEKDDFDANALDNLLQPFIRYDEILDQIDDAEKIEMTEIKGE